MSELREKWAEKEHKQWLRWAGTVIKDLYVISSGHHVDCDCPSCKRIKRWKPNMIPYSDLPDDVKEYDRQEVDLVTPLISEELDELDELPVIKFTKKEILGLIPAQAILDYDRAEEVLRAVAQTEHGNLIKEMKGRMG